MCGTAWLKMLCGCKKPHVYGGDSIKSCEGRDAGFGTDLRWTSIYLGLPLHRIHCDRARELTSAPIRRWTLDRGLITTLTTGSSYKTNGRVENEAGAAKRAVRTLISAKLCPLESWPLALRHVGERRLRCQLQGAGWPAAPLLKFGTRAFALKTSIMARTI